MTFSPICRPWDGNTSTSPAITSGHPICRKTSTDCEPCVPPPPTFAKLPNVLVLSAYATISHEPLVPAALILDRVLVLSAYILRVIVCGAVLGAVLVMWQTA